MSRNVEKRTTQRRGNESADTGWGHAPSEKAYTYTLVQSGPRPSPEEVEIAGATALEVVILWDQTVLHVAHSSPPRSFYVGERSTRDGACDFVMPMDALGVSRAPVVLATGEWTRLVFLRGARGIVEIPGESAMSLAEAVDAGFAQPHAAIAGAHEVLLPAGGKARMEQGGLVFHVAAVAAGKAVGGAIFDGDPAALLYSGLSLAAHAGIFATMAAFVPPLGITDREERDRDQAYLMTQYLEAAAAREPEERPTDAIPEKPGEKGGSPGSRASGEEGVMGNPNAPAVARRYAVAGPEKNVDPHLARRSAIAEASEFGIIGLLDVGAGGDPRAPTSPWGGYESLGNDPFSARGNLWAETLGESLGGSGLGLSGTGDSAGGNGTAIGLTDIGTLFRGNGGDGAFSTGRPLGHVHQPSGPRMRIGVTTVNGQLPSEVIQRIVRQNYGRFRLCYENGLRRNPSLEGRISVRFVIGRDGAVTHAKNGDSDLPDASVVECVIHAYYDLSFPAPEGGIVTVVYPIVFSPGQ